MAWTLWAGWLHHPIGEKKSLLRSRPNLCFCVFLRPLHPRNSGLSGSKPWPEAMITMERRTPIRPARAGRQYNLCLFVHFAVFCSKLFWQFHRRSRRQRRFLVASAFLHPGLVSSLAPSFLVPPCGKPINAETVLGAPMPSLPRGGTDSIRENPCNPCLKKESPENIRGSVRPGPNHPRPGERRISTEENKGNKVWKPISPLRCLRLLL